MFELLNDVLRIRSFGNFFSNVEMLRLVKCCFHEKAMCRRGAVFPGHVVVGGVF